MTFAPAWIAIGALVAAPAAAQLGVGLHAGTTGLGPEVSWGLGERARARAALAGFDQDLDVTASDVRYEGELELRHALLLLDWHPGGGGFRLTAGAAWNDNRLVGTAPLAELFADDLERLARQGIDLRGRDLGTAHAEATTDALGPYLGLGFGKAPAGGRGVGLTLDVGAIYQGPPQVELRAETPLPIDQVPGARQALDGLIADEERDIEDEADGYRFFPVVAVGLAYRF